MMAHPTFIVSGVRTPIGVLGGTLSSVPATQLGATCIKALMASSGVPPGRVAEVIMGQVIGAGLGPNPARRAAIDAGLPASVAATTVNKGRGSGLKAVILADQAIRLGEASLIIAGGMESMSRAPYLLPEARQGYRMGHGELLDAMIQDGLSDVCGVEPSGVSNQCCASRSGVGMEQEFAALSRSRARQAMKQGVFLEEIVPVEATLRGRRTTVAVDEGPSGSEGTIAGPNPTGAADGAAALLLASGAACEQCAIVPRARIVGATTFGVQPDLDALAPAGALRQLMERIGWTVATTDLFEINESLAAVPMAAEKELPIPAAKVNIHGGALALGDPIGCSGARILVTLIHGLRRTRGRRGIACLCTGGGEAVAMAVELIR